MKRNKTINRRRLIYIKHHKPRKVRPLKYPNPNYHARNADRIMFSLSVSRKTENLIMNKNKRFSIADILFIGLVLFGAYTILKNASCTE